MGEGGESSEQFADAGLRCRKKCFCFPCVAGDKTAGLPFCTAKLPEGRAPWMVRVHLPGGLKGALLAKDSNVKSAPIRVTCRSCGSPSGRLRRSLRHPAFAVGTFPRYAGEGKSRNPDSPRETGWG